MCGRGGEGAQGPRIEREGPLGLSPTPRARRERRCAWERAVWPQADPQPASAREARLQRRPRGPQRGLRFLWNEVLGAEVSASKQSGDSRERRD